MNVKRVLGRLAPRVSRLGEKCGRERDAVGWSEVAAALAAVDDPLMALLLRVKWGQQERYAPELAQWMEDRTIRYFHHRQWRTLNEERIRTLARMVLAQVIRQESCPQCEGREGEDGQTVWLDERRVSHTCPLCLGTGNSKPPSDRKQAQMLGISPSGWRKSWQERFDILEQWLRRGERRALMQVWLALTGGGQERI